MRWQNILRVDYSRIPMSRTLEEQLRVGIWDFPYAQSTKHFKGDQVFENIVDVAES